MAYAPRDTAQARHYFTQALRLSQRAGYGFGEVRALMNRGSLHNQLNQNAAAHRCYQLAARKCAQLYRQRPEKRLLKYLAMLANNEGALLAKRGEYAAQVQVLLRAAAYTVQARDSVFLGFIYNTLGQRFYMLD